MSTYAHDQRGFTLIEMMVSVALFSVVITIVATAYLNLLNLDRQTRGTNDVVNNLSFVVDSMSRSIRTGSGYVCTGPGNNCPNGSSTFTFTNDSGCVITYSLTAQHQINEAIASGPVCTVASSATITDPRITIDALTFYVTGVPTSDRSQPQVVMVIHGSLQVDPNHPSVSFGIETTATQRKINI
jgi:prepilin-type N-terminal cleavage/methylation domain-containing protein